MKTNRTFFYEWTELFVLFVNNYVINTSRVFNLHLYCFVIWAMFYYSFLCFYLWMSKFKNYYAYFSFIYFISLIIETTNSYIISTFCKDHKSYFYLAGFGSCCSIWFLTWRALLSCSHSWGVKEMWIVIPAWIIELIALLKSKLASNTSTGQFRIFHGLFFCSFNNCFKYLYLVSSIHSY